MGLGRQTRCRVQQTTGLQFPVIRKQALLRHPAKCADRPFILLPHEVSDLSKGARTLCPFPLYTFHTRSVPPYKPELRKSCTWALHCIKALTYSGSPLLA